MQNIICVKDKYIGDRQPVFIIAEAGVNHNGDISRAKEMVCAAKDAGADAVKFQTGNVSETIVRTAPKAAYQKDTTDPNETQYEMIEKLQFTDDEWLELANFAHKQGIVFFSKPSHEEAVDLLVQMQVPLLKIGSGEVDHVSLLQKMAQTNLPIILSTGMSTLGEVEEAVTILKDCGARELVLLHCTSNYPADFDSLNLRAMQTLKRAFGVPVGYSDHSMGITAPITATALGACVIEKHFTLDKSLPGPDHKASLEPNEFKAMVRSIRDTEKALGSSVKKIQHKELEVRNVARKSIVARDDIPKGVIITKEMLGYKRPGTGLPQKYLGSIVGKKSQQHINKDEQITWHMI
jgi:N-acetylneuraminate synthase